MNGKTLKAIRGATCSANEKSEITQNTVYLYDKLLTANGLAETDIVSLFFSLTADLDAINPASALRRSGRAGETAMMVLQEAAVQDSIPGTIRILIHVYLPTEKPVQHVYIHGAEKLRPEWEKST